MAKHSTKDAVSYNQKPIVFNATKVKSQKVKQVVSLLNNTMPMPKLMIDLGAPSTGGSTDVIQQRESAEAIFKNNLKMLA